LRKFVTCLKCPKCGGEYAVKPDFTTCPACHQDIEHLSVLDLVYDYSALKEVLISNNILFNSRNCYSKGIWRFKELLADVPPEFQFTLGEGHTPIIRASLLGKDYGIEELYLKNETGNPTGSYKDRLAPVIVAKAKEAGAEAISLVSSGNMAAAVAAYAALAEIKTYVILPPDTPGEKIAQIRLYGGHTLKVKGTGSDRISLNEAAVREPGWFNGNSPFTPYGSEGVKTMAYEEWEYFGSALPDWIVLPVGFADNLVGHWKGFRDLQNLGLIDKQPKLAGVQPEGSPSFVDGFLAGKDEAIPGKQETIAGGISQRVTLNAYLGLKAVRETGGTALTVTDAELLEAERELALKAGIFAEPTGVAGLAGARKMRQQGIIKAGERVLVVVTGSGFKDNDSARKLAVQEGQGQVLDADLESLRKAIKRK
jgi:threonine synthase